MKIKSIETINTKSYKIIVDSDYLPEYRTFGDGDYWERSYEFGWEESYPEDNIINEVKEFIQDLKSNQYAYGYVSNPVQYAINCLERISNLIGQDKQVEIAIIALKEYQKEIE